MSQLVFIAFQDNDNARYLAEAIMEDNPEAELQHQPAMLIDVISIGGNVDEDDDHFILQWN